MGCLFGCPFVRSLSCSCASVLACLFVHLFFRSCVILACLVLQLFGCVLVWWFDCVFVYSFVFLVVGWLSTVRLLFGCSCVCLFYCSSSPCRHDVTAVAALLIRQVSVWCTLINSHEKLWLESHSTQNVTRHAIPISRIRPTESNNWPLLDFLCQLAVQSPHDWNFHFCKNNFLALFL